MGSSGSARKNRQQLTVQGTMALPVIQETPGGLPQTSGTPETRLQELDKLSETTT